MLGRGEPDDELLALYALDALGDEERRAVESAVAASPALAERLAYHHDTAAMLGASVAAEPPPDLKQRILAEAFAQAPPRPQEEQSAAPSVVVPFAPRRRRTAAAMFAVAAAAAAVVVGAVVIRNDDTASQDARAVLIGEAGSMTVITDDDRILISGSGVVPLGPTQTYQLWLVEPDQSVRSAGLFVPEGDGSVEVELSGGFGDATGLAVSLEPSGGSPDPSGPTGPVTFSAEIER